jgi:hypothetical protein
VVVVCQRILLTQTKAKCIPQGPLTVAFTGTWVFDSDPVSFDPAFVDPAFVDPAFVDPAFVDPVFVDPDSSDPDSCCSVPPSSLCHPCIVR